jgi:CRP-like cAMP-binding protein
MAIVKHGGNTGRAALEAVLANVALFAELPAEARAKLAADFQVFEVDEGRMVIEQGGTDRELYVLVSGALVGSLVTEDGRQIGFTNIREHAYFGEMSALDGRPRSITVTATVPCTLARLPVAAFRRWIEAHPSIAVNLAIDLSERNRELNQRVFGLIAHDVGTRVRLLLCQIAQEAGELKAGGVVSPAPTHEAMASFVGANREAVSRVISRLGREGLIEKGRQRIVIKDLPGLLDGL